MSQTVTTDSTAAKAPPKPGALARAAALAAAGLLLSPLPAPADTAPRCAALAERALASWTQLLAARETEAEAPALDRLVNLVTLHNALDCQSSPLAEAMDCVTQQARSGEADGAATTLCLSRADLRPPQ